MQNNAKGERAPQAVVPAVYPYVETAISHQFIVVKLVCVLGDKYGLHASAV